MYVNKLNITLGTYIIFYLWYIIFLSIFFNLFSNILSLRFYRDFNYRDDKHLHDRLDKEGWVPISEIANFNMVQVIFSQLIFLNNN